MKFPESWLREHVELAADRATLAATLTAIGLEVEAETVSVAAVARVVVGGVRVAEGRGRLQLPVIEVEQVVGLLGGRVLVRQREVDLGLEVVRPVLGRGQVGRQVADDGVEAARGQVRRDVEVERIQSGEKTLAEAWPTLRDGLRKTAHQFGKDYVLWPLLTGPLFLSTLAANATIASVRDFTGTSG